MDIGDRISASHVVRSWWLVALRGVAATLFGLFVLVRPELGLSALATLFSIYAFAYGVLTLGTVLFRQRDEPHWVPALVGGCLGVVAGVVGLLAPFTPMTLLLLIAAFMFVTGVTEMMDAARLRPMIEDEWILGLTGALSVIVGLLLAMFPGPGVLGVVLWIGAWGIGVGVLTLVLGYELRRWGLRHAGPGQA